ncbi:hypothetical protein J4U02_gp066 [Mycobacterium phage Aziz]|uniref:Uncharacterized protein n=1 Tax=Mycobacterium phage Aziz TaxID=2762281 RepID=A0A7G8LHK4_9CAUD|nr:hypothetical protein J4U02_gp066 [Mycobacterium phage Aziz]ASR75913.1 hypothetical protein SEA_GENEVAB15_67 [Mycobacterium phage GenevaB15]QNJ56726.1 hypothetical protein SEA_AZIZ_66 [Mycobacterium phage Aziz]
MSWDDSEDYVYTELSPQLLDQLLDKNSFLMNKWDKLLAWHRAQFRWYETRFNTAQKVAEFKDKGPATKAKAASFADAQVQQCQLDMDIAYMQLGTCERRVHSLDKEAMNLGMRNKLLGTLYNNGGGNY